MGHLRVHLMSSLEEDRHKLDQEVHSNLLAFVLHFSELELELSRFFCREDRMFCLLSFSASASSISMNAFLFPGVLRRHHLPLQRCQHSPLPMCLHKVHIFIVTFEYFV